MISLIYISNSTQSFSQPELERMLSSFVENNASKGITGVLLYNGMGTFVQMLEGDAEVVEPLYEKIKQDKRHNRVNCIRRKNIQTRQFPEWKMGYRNLSKDVLQDNPYFIDFLSDDALENFLSTETDLAFSVLTHFKNVTKELIF